MRFKMYDLKITNNESIIKISDLINSRKLVERFIKLPLIKDDENDEIKFTPMYSTFKSNILLSTLVQEYKIQLKKFDENQKKENELPPDKNNDNTYFFIDILESKIYLQNKRYPQESLLSSNRTVDRIQIMLKEVLNEHEISVQLVPITVSYTVEDFQEFLKKSIVKYIKALNLEGLEIPEGAVLHNPREDLDAALAESWNCYSKDTIDTIEIKAKKGKNINKNPLVKIAMLLAKRNKDVTVLRKMEIIDDGQSEVIKPEGNDYKIVSISSAKQKDHTAVYEKIIETTLKE